MATDERVFELCVYLAGGGEITVMVDREAMATFEEAVTKTPQDKTFTFGDVEGGSLIVLLQYVRAYDSVPVTVAEIPVPDPTDRTGHNVVSGEN